MGRTDSRSSILGLLVKPILSGLRLNDHPQVHWLTESEGGRETRFE
jgi:hypothetical protein